MISDDGIWDDGEWVSWHDINEQIRYQEWRAKYPNADLSLVPIFEHLISVAEQYHTATGRHLQVYGDIGELFGAITYGIKPHRNYACGSDGKLGNDFVEVKTITPFKKRDSVIVNPKGNFSKLLVVKINADFQISGRLIERSRIKRKGRLWRVTWDELLVPTPSSAI